jgi:hypothetical protein
MMHLHITPVTEQCHGELDDVDLGGGRESDHICGCPFPNLNATVEPSGVLRRWRRTRETPTVELFESHPEAEVFGIDPDKGVHDSVPIAPVEIAIRVLELAQ